MIGRSRTVDARRLAAAAAIVFAFAVIAAAVRIRASAER
jgi:hypothetical protein